MPSKKAPRKAAVKTVKSKTVKKAQSAEPAWSIRGPVAMVAMMKIRTIRKRMSVRYASFMARRPHRSFQTTRRRDYVRSLKLPGYIAFTAHVNGILKKHKKLFITLVVFYAVVMLLLGGVTSQETYSQINDLVKESSGEVMTGAWGKVGEAGLLLVSAFAGGPGTLTVDQQIYLSFLLLLVWLTAVWLLRELFAGRSPRLRDGLYNAGAPIVSTLAVLVLLIVQLLPIGLLALIYPGFLSTGLITEGFGSMLFYLTAAAVGTLVLYWATSTLLALVIITLPGMYPMNALRAAGDLVVGRRLRVLYRFLWALLMIVLAWAVIVIPLVLLDTLIKDTWPNIAGLPVMPVVVAFMSAATTVWFSSYVYILYRRIVDDDAKPA